MIRLYMLCRSLCMLCSICGTSFCCFVACSCFSLCDMPYCSQDQRHGIPKPLLSSPLTHRLSPPSRTRASTSPRTSTSHRLPLKTIPVPRAIPTPARLQRLAKLEVLLHSGWRAGNSRQRLLHAHIAPSWCHCAAGETQSLLLRRTEEGRL